MGGSRDRKTRHPTVTEIWSWLPPRYAQAKLNFNLNPLKFHLWVEESAQISKNLIRKIRKFSFRKWNFFLGESRGWNKVKFHFESIRHFSNLENRGISWLSWIIMISFVIMVKNRLMFHHCSKKLWKKYFGVSYFK